MVAALATLGVPGAAGAGEVRVAVAANFMGAAKEIAALFERETGHRAVLSFASTGQLYTQIAQGAPFDVFLAADRERPARAVQEGFGLAGSRATYAIGRIVLFSKDAGLVKGIVTLRRGTFTRIAIANPVTAPYGGAAVEVMKSLGAYEALAPRIVQGNNVAQAYQFVQTGNAELGFVALAQVARHGEGSRWIVPLSLHRGIPQDAVLLTRGAGNAAAGAFLGFLGGPAARAVKEKYGYGAGD